MLQSIMASQMFVMRNRLQEEGILTNTPGKKYIQYSPAILEKEHLQCKMLKISLSVDIFYSHNLISVSILFCYYVSFNVVNYLDTVAS